MRFEFVPKTPENARRVLQVESLEGRAMFSAAAMVPAAFGDMSVTHGHVMDLTPATARPIATPAQATHLSVTAVESGDEATLVAFCNQLQDNPFAGRVGGGVSELNTTMLHTHTKSSMAGRPPTLDRLARPATEPMKVLIIEDDPTSRAALSALLKRQGFSVSVAGTAAEGVRKLSEHPDHVVIDLNLPDGTGENVLKAVRQKEPHARVTVMTGVSDPTRLANVAKLRPTGVLAKPIKVSALIRQMTELN